MLLTQALAVCFLGLCSTQRVLEFFIHLPQPLRGVPPYHLVMLASIHSLPFPHLLVWFAWSGGMSQQECRGQRSTVVCQSLLRPCGTQGWGSAPQAGWQMPFFTHCTVPLTCLYYSLNSVSVFLNIQASVYVAAVCVLFILLSPFS